MVAPEWPFSRTRAYTERAELRDQRLARGRVRT
jgi:hypothetical protein